MKRSAAAALLFLGLCLSVSGCTTNGGEAGTVRSTKEVVVIVEAPPVEVTTESGGIDGVVVDEEFQPVAGADVVLVGRDVSTASDLAGRFTFSVLEPGEYKLTIKKSGFAVAGRSVPVAAGEISTLQVTLKTIQFDVPYTVVKPWTGAIVAGYFIINVGESASGSNTCSACPLPCGTCFTNFNTTRGLRVLVFELSAKPSVSNPTQPNDYFWQLLGKSRAYQRYNADYWIDKGKRHVEGGWPEGGEDFKFTNQCGLYWPCINQRFTVYFSQFYFQGPAANYTALPPG